MAVLNPFGQALPRFSDEQIEDINEWFDANSKPLLVIDESELINVITVDQFQQFLGLKKYHRRHFHYPTYAEIMYQLDQLKMGTYRMVTKEQFLFILDKFVQLPNLRHELLMAFKAFDVEKRDFLDMEELKTIVTTYGDVLNEDEVRELMRDVNVRGDGNVIYADFIESLFSVAPELNDIKAEYLYDDPDEDPSVPPEPEPEPEPEVAVEETKPPVPPKPDNQAKSAAKKKK